MRNMVGWVAVAIAVAACGGSQGKEPQAAEGQNAAESSPLLVESPPQAEGSAAPSAPAVSAGRPREDLIPRSILFGNPDRADVQISPDGKYLSWLRAVEGRAQRVGRPLGKLDQAKAVTADEKRPVTRYFWALTASTSSTCRTPAATRTSTSTASTSTSGEVGRPHAVRRSARADVRCAHRAQARPRCSSASTIATRRCSTSTSSTSTTGERTLVVQERPGLRRLHHRRRPRRRGSRSKMAPGRRLPMLFARDGEKGWQDRTIASLRTTRLTTGSGRLRQARRQRYYALDSRGRDTGAPVRGRRQDASKKTLLAEDAAGRRRRRAHAPDRAHGAGGRVHLRPQRAGRCSTSRSPSDLDGARKARRRRVRDHLRARSTTRRGSSSLRRATALRRATTATTARRRRPTFLFSDAARARGAAARQHAAGRDPARATASTWSAT